MEIIFPKDFYTEILQTHTEMCDLLQEYKNKRMEIKKELDLIPSPVKVTNEKVTDELEPSIFKLCNCNHWIVHYSIAKQKKLVKYIELQRSIYDSIRHNFEKIKNLQEGDREDIYKNFKKDVNKIKKNFVITRKKMIDFQEITKSFVLKKESMIQEKNVDFQYLDNNEIYKLQEKIIKIIQKLDDAYYVISKFFDFYNEEKLTLIKAKFEINNLTDREKVRFYKKIDKQQKETIRALKIMVLWLIMLCNSSFISSKIFALIVCIKKAKITRWFTSK